MERVLDSARSCLDLRMWVWRFRWVVAVNCLIHGEDIFSRVVNGVFVKLLDFELIVPFLVLTTSRIDRVYIVRAFRCSLLPTEYVDVT